MYDKGVYNIIFIMFLVSHKHITIYEVYNIFKHNVTYKSVKRSYWKTDDTLGNLHSYESYSTYVTFSTLG